MRTITPTIKAVALDRTQDYVDGSPEFKDAGRIYDVYVYDASLHVHICSFTPCYEMYYVHSFAEHEDEQVEILLIEANSQTDMVTYINTYDIDRVRRMHKTINKFLVRKWKEFLFDYWDGDEQRAYDAMMEGYVESLNANWPF